MDPVIDTPPGNKRRRATYNGQKFYEGKDGYWQVNRRIGPGDGERLLHRVVWANTHGPIPAGYDVHHIDEIRAHNRLGNLEMVEHGKHMRHHGDDNYLAPLTVEQRSGYATASWARKQPRQRFCLWCWCEFWSTGQRAKYCGVQHRDAYKWANRSRV